MNSDTPSPKAGESIAPPPGQAASPTVDGILERSPHLSPHEQKLQTLQEAFPNVDMGIIKAVLVASGGSLEPAFNALLSMSDPNAVELAAPPPPPPRPQTKAPAALKSFSEEHITSTPESQLASDARFAAALQEQYERRPTKSHVGSAGAGLRQSRRRDDDDDDDYYYESDKDHSFFDDDLPVIKENIKRGFLETQTKVNGWISDLKKRIDAEFPESPPPDSQTTSSQYSRSGSRRFADPRRRSSRDVGYDADPAVLSDDFSHLAVKDGGTDAQMKGRQKADSHLLQPSPTPGKTRNVSFEEQPTTINNDGATRSDRDTTRADTVAGLPRQPSPIQGSKWEPLKAVEPAPMDRDPFSLGDSDDEKDGLIKEGEPVKASVTSPQESGITKE